MLNIYKTNRVELITEVIAKELLINPPFITENLSISIQNYFLGKWMRDQITIQNEISALYDFQTLTTYTEDIIKTIYKNQKVKSWNNESIKWCVIESFEELRKFKEYWPLSNWIEKFINQKKIVNREIYTLSGKIAKSYSDYILYRPEIIERWHNTDLGNSKLFLGLNKDQYWQPILYKLVENKLDKPICLYMREIINNINSLKQNTELLIPKNIYIIAINNLSKLQISFYSKLSELTNVNIYLLSPGYNLWERIYTEEGAISLNNKNYKNASLPMESIERIFGKFIANSEKLIEETIFNEELKVNIESPYIDPSINLIGNKKSSLLKQIQKKLVNGSNKKIKINKNDKSLIFRGCKNILKELSYIKNKIIYICSLNQDIKYSDILICSNQITNLIPYLKYIFNSDNQIPYILSIENYKDKSQIYNLLNLFIEIANKKVTSTEIRQLLGEPILQSIFNFNNTEKDELLSHLIDSGFHWGINQKERLGESKNTLEWCIKRFTLGIIYSKDFYIEENELKPYSAFNTSIDINKWINILNKIIIIIENLRTSNSFENWILIFKDIFESFDTQNENINEDIKNLFHILEDISLKINSDIVIELDLLKELLNKYFNDQKINLHKRKDQILISDLQSARLLPHKITFIMGMNQNIYPSVINKENINLLNSEYKFGDPSLIEKEKYFFLELLLSCREQLIISWSNNDIENNKLEISLPIIQLIKIIKDQVDFKNHYNLIKNIDINSDQTQNFYNKSIPAKEGLISSLEFENKTLKNENFKLLELINWFKGPQLYWLKQKNIFPKKKFIYNPSDEKISNYQRYKLLNNILEDFNIDDKSLIIKLNELNIKEKLISNGIISPHNSIYINELEVYEIIQSLIHNLQDLNNIQRKYQKLKSNKVEYFKCDNEIIEIIHSNINYAKRSETWIRLLFITSLDKDIKKARIIYRKNNIYNKEVIIAPSQLEAIKLINTYLNIYHNSLRNCLPIPPESSYNYTLALMKNKEPEKAFIEEWIGNKNFKLGERDKSEMQICYGYEQDPYFFMNNKNFHELSLELYRPIIESILKK